MRMPLIALAVLLAAAAPASAVVEIHAHRGGPLLNGQAKLPEDAQPAFEYGHSIGTDVVELDVKLSSDRVPFVLHDATLDRTTDCTGQIAQRSAADLATCHVDTIGTEGKITQVPGARVPIPRLADVLAWAKAEGVRLNLEIKNQPTDPDYDGSPAFARAVLGAVVDSGIPKDQALIQSFWPPNLDEAKAMGFETSFLSLAQTNEQAIEFARTRGYDVLSPAWPVSSDPKAYVARAHAAGLPVVPYTFNEAKDVRDAVDAGVDAVITNDVPVAQQVIYGIDCDGARSREAARRSDLTAARRARAAAGVRRVNLKRQAAKRLRLKVCTPGT
jgi:glycerophosphoryl diester phosphodiesterase